MSIEARRAMVSCNCDHPAPHSHYIEFVLFHTSCTARITCFTHDGPVPLPCGNIQRGDIHDSPNSISLYNEELEALRSLLRGEG